MPRLLPPFAALLLASCHPPTIDPDARHPPSEADPSQDSQADSQPDSAADTAEPFEGGEPFSVVLLPDTQLYSQDYPELFAAQTSWVLDNRDAEAIAFVLHEGDITNDNGSTQWGNAKAAMEILDDQVPYVLAVGNHDMGSGGSADERDTTLFNSHFPISLFQDQTWFGGVFEPDRIDNLYALFEAGGVSWLVFGLEFGPRDEVLDWVWQVAQEHAERSVMVVTHTHVYSDDSLHGTLSSHSWNPHTYGLDQDKGDVNDGVEVWDALQDLSNLTFFFNGHILNDGVGRVTGTGSSGNQVHQLLANYQTLSNGGDGWLRLLRFIPGSRRVDVETWSPVLQRHNGDIQQAFSIHGLELFSEADGDAPGIEVLSSLGGAAQLALVFDETLDQETAGDATNYQLDGGASVLSATLAADERTVTLELSGAQLGSAYTLLIDGVRDASVHRNRASGLSGSFAPADRFADDFDDGDMEGWQVVQQGNTSGPAWWEAAGGSLVQRSNVYGDDRAGSYVYLDDPLAMGWSDYTLTASLRSEDNDGIGLLVRLQEDGSCYKLDLDSERSFRQLVRIQDGQQTVLAESWEGYAQDQTMAVELQVQGSGIRVSLDGQILFGGEVQDGELSAGTAGLYCWGNEGCWFDDVAVEGF